MSKLYEDNNKVFTTLHAVAGFQNTGIYPLNKNAIDHSKLQITYTFDQTDNINNELTSYQQQPAPTTPSSPSIQLKQMILNKAKEAIELSLKRHFQLQAASHVKKTKKTKKTDVRPLFDGQIITAESVVEKIKQKELENANKKNKIKRRLTFESSQSQVISSKSQTQSSQSQVPSSESSQSKKCFKCRQDFDIDMLLCENSKCMKWLCKTCRPKRFKERTSFYCCKKCREAN